MTVSTLKREVLALRRKTEELLRWGNDLLTERDRLRTELRSAQLRLLTRQETKLLPDRAGETNAKP